MGARLGLAGLIALTFAVLMLGGQGRAEGTCDESARPLGLAGIDSIGGSSTLVRALDHRIAVSARFTPYLTGRPVHASFSLVALNPRRPISHPVEISDSEDFGHFDEKEPPSTVFLPGDGPGVATWTWEDSRRPGCIRVYSYVLRPIAGSKPAFETNTEAGQAVLIARIPDFCPFRLAPGPESVSLFDERGSQTMRIANDCDFRFSPTELESPDWLAESHGRSIRILPRFDEQGAHRIPYEARFRGKVFASGTINVVTHGLSSRVTSIGRK